jgi:hypothetical protein
MYPECSIPDCRKPPQARGWCWVHLQRWYRHGDPVYERPPPPPKPPGLYSLNIAQRLFGRVEITDTCWLWVGSKTPLGYGHMSFQAKPHSVHRVAYELCAGPIPEGLTIDHLCRIRHCCNPDHLEAVPLRTNILRSPIQPSAINARKTHCKRGHEFTPENTYIRPLPGRKRPNRSCRICIRRHSAVQYARRKALVHP